MARACVSRTLSRTLKCSITYSQLPTEGGPVLAIPYPTRYVKTSRCDAKV